MSTEQQDATRFRSSAENEDICLICGEHIMKHIAICERCYANRGTFADTKPCHCGFVSMLLVCPPKEAN